MSPSQSLLIVRTVTLTVHSHGSNHKCLRKLCLIKEVVPNNILRS